MFSGVDVATFSMVDRGRTGITLSKTLSRFLVTFGIGFVGVVGGATCRFVGFGDTAGLVMLGWDGGASGFWLSSESGLELDAAEADLAGFSPIADLSLKFMLRFHLKRYSSLSLSRPWLLLLHSEALWSQLKQTEQAGG